MRSALIMLMLLAALPARAAVVHSPEAMSLAGPMVADVSQTHVQIHSSFTGTQLLVFGARNEGGDLVIAVRGPQANVNLRRKERIAGMWMHVEQHKYPELPLFYAMASTRPLEEIAPLYLLHQLGLGEEQVIARSNASGNEVFDKALAQYLGTRRVWQEPFDTITYFGESLFKARLDLPDTLPRGEYSVEVYLFKNQKLTALQTVPLSAYKTGMDARIYDEAEHNPWAYGLAAVLMALAGGWLAHRLFHK